MAKRGQTAGQNAADGPQRPVAQQIEQIATADLIPYARNARTHSEQQVGQIAGSIQEFGFNNPVLIDGQNSIIAGHGRVLAAQRLKLETVPCIRLTHLTDAQRRAYVLADNRIALNSGWDEAMLSVELAELHAEELDLGLLGFDAGELEKLMGFELEDNKNEITEDEAPEPPVDPITKPGDLWLLGDHRLLCGDSTKAEDVERLMAGKKAGMVFTDPPYGIKFQSNFREKTPQFEKIANDDTILNISPILSSVMQENTAAYVCTRWDVYPQWCGQLSEFSIKNCVVWYKRGGGLGDLANCFSPNHEFLIVAHNGTAPLRGKRLPDVWEVARDSVAAYDHPTQKPVGLPAIAIEAHSDIHDVVMDLFLGSGTTLIAAEQLGRKCYGMEISPAYCDVIVKRWETLTGRKAQLEAP